MKPLTSDLKKKILERVKSKIDISDLIEGVDLRGADLSNTIIKKLRITDVDISNSNFSGSQLGDETGQTIFTIIRCKLNNCNFFGTKFVGKAWVRSCTAHNCNLNESDVSKVSYEHTDFTGSTFCGATLRIGTREGIGCIFPKGLLEDLTKEWINKPTIS